MFFLYLQLLYLFAIVIFMQTKKILLWFLLNVLFQGAPRYSRSGARVREDRYLGQVCIYKRNARMFFTWQPHHNFRNHIFITVFLTDLVQILMISKHT